MISGQAVNLVGAESVAGLLMVGTISGVLLAMLMNNGGGAWDNAKKFIETGQYGGKKSDAHKAAVVGDTVGDPFKDTAGTEPACADQAAGDDYAGAGSAVRLRRGCADHLRYSLLWRNSG